MKKLALLLIAVALLMPLRSRAEGEPSWWEDTSKPWFTANVVDQNTLSVLLSAQLSVSQTLADVQYLRISGNLGAEDINLIKTALPNVVEVDLYDLNLTVLPDKLFSSSSYDTSKRNLLERVRLPRNLVSTGSFAFYDCPKLEEVVVPPTLKTVDYYAFSNCKAFKVFDFSVAPLTSIGYSGFSSTAITSAHLPSTLETIDSYAFENCKSLAQVSFPDYLKKMDSCAFRGCTSLTSVDFPLLGTIGSNLFEGCTSLATVNLPEGLGVIWSYMFSYCTSLTSVTLPSTITRITNRAFSNCTALAQINLNEGLREISSDAFFRTAITEITLPSTIINLYSTPFSECSNLTTIYCKAYIPPMVNTSLFNTGDSKARTLVVPAASRAAYQTAQGWNGFSAYAEMPAEFFPSSLTIFKETTLISPANQPADWKPQVKLASGLDAITLFGSEYATNNPCFYDFGSLRIIGENSLEFSSLSMKFDEYRRRSQNSLSYFPKAFSFYAQLLPQVPVTADRVEIDWTFNSYGSSYWHFISFPFDVDLADHDFDAQGHNFVVYEYDGSLRAAGQNGWKRVANDSRLTANKGYIFSLSGYVNGTSVSDETMLFHSVNNAANTFTVPIDDLTFDLPLYPSEYSHNAGWNLIGNPYTCYFDSRFIDFDGPITVRTATNTSSNSYKAYSLIDDSYILSPGEAFFVQASPTAQQITFDKAGRQLTREVRTIEPSAAPARAAAQNANRILVNLILSDGENEDHTRVVLNSEASTKYESSRDAAKFFSEDSTVPQICSLTEGVQYAINELPDPQQDIALFTRINKAGRYTISLGQPAADCSVELVDLKKGVTFDLASGPYSFDAEAGEPTGRFALRINSGFTSIEGIDNDTETGRDIWFNLQGIRIDSPASPGIYIHNGKKVIVK